MSGYDGGDECGLPAYDALTLDTGVPAAMDAPTLIEWLERQLETPEQTARREAYRKARHRQWHRQTWGIYACCINVGQDWFTEEADAAIVGAGLHGEPHDHDERRQVGS